MSGRLANLNYLLQRVRKAGECFVFGKASPVSKGLTDGQEAGFLRGKRPRQLQRWSH